MVMKVRILSGDKTRFDEIRQILVAGDRSADISGAVGNVTELPAVVNGHPPDILVLDAAQGWSLDLLDQISTRAPKMDAILISNDQSPQFLLKAMRAGVREVLPATLSAEALHSAVNRVREKRGY